MPKNCSIPGCDGKDTRRLSFPVNSQTLKIWLERINDPRLSAMDPMQLRQKCRVCSRHFESECFTGVTGRLRLSSVALPTKNLTGYTNRSPEDWLLKRTSPRRAAPLSITGNVDGTTQSSLSPGKLSLIPPDRVYRRKRLLSIEEDPGPSLGIEQPTRNVHGSPQSSLSPGKLPVTPPDRKYGRKRLFSNEEDPGPSSRIEQPTSQTKPILGSRRVPKDREMAHSYKLIYFDFRGRAEVTRILFHYGDIKYVDKRLTFEEWPTFKSSTPYAQLPVLEIDGKLYNDSKSIARYAGEEVKLAGRNNLENLEINSVVDALYDLEVAIVEYSFYEKDEGRKKVLLEKLLKTTLPSVLTTLDGIAASNGGYLALKRLTWADIYFANFVEMTVNELKTDVFKDFPNLKKVVRNVVNQPKLKQHFLTRKAVEEYKYDLKSEIQ